MNTLKTLSTIAFSLLVFGIATAQDEGLVPASALPANAQTFVNQYFSANDIVSVWQDTEKGKVEEYTVLFADGTEVDKKFPKAMIKEIKKGRTKYEIDLTNNVELLFNLNGNFLKIDD